MIPPKHFTAKLSEKVILNEKFSHFYFELAEPNTMQFEAGQYVSLAVHDEGHRRSYSICSEPDKLHGFELLVDLSPQGLGTKYLEELKFGEQISILSPMGRFVVTPEVASSPMVFIATGSGIAPFRSMLLDQLQDKKNTQPMTLYFGLRFVEDLFWQDEFEQLMRSYPNFKFHPVISKASPEWPLCRGRVTDCLSVHEFDMKAHYFLCGNNKMIEDMLVLLAGKGLPKEQVHREQFY